MKRDRRVWWLICVQSIEWAQFISELPEFMPSPMEHRSKYEKEEFYFFLWKFRTFEVQIHESFAPSQYNMDHFKIYLICILIWTYLKMGDWTKDTCFIHLQNCLKRLLQRMSFLKAFEIDLRVTKFKMHWITCFILYRVYYSLCFKESLTYLFCLSFRILMICLSKILCITSFR